MFVGWSQSVKYTLRSRYTSLNQPDDDLVHRSVIRTLDNRDMNPEPPFSRRHLLGSLCLSTIFLMPGCGEAATSAPFLASRKKTTPLAAKLIASARQQIGVTNSYDPAYTQIAYPLGDVPRSKGVCTDVVIRAYRDALNIDLQQLVHHDMKTNFTLYPTRWGLAAPDSNIDHRRVLNLHTFLTRQGAALPITRNAQDWRPGDIFTSMIGGKLPHIGIVSDRVENGLPLAIHNIGRGTREEDVVFSHNLTGHFRWRLT